MSEIDYKRSMNHSYMVISKENEKSVTGYQLKMIHENNIEGLLFCDVREEEGKNKVYYDISGCESIEEHYMFQEMDYAFCKNLMEQLFFVQEELQKYLLDDQNLILTPGQIFYHSAEKKILFTYYPDGESEEQIYQVLAEYMLEKVNHKDDKAVKIAYSFYKETRCQQFTIQSMKHIMEEMEREEKAAMQIMQEKEIVLEKNTEVSDQNQDIKSKIIEFPKNNMTVSKKKRKEICAGCYLLAIVCILYIYFEPVSIAEMIGFMVCSVISVIVGMYFALSNSPMTGKKEKKKKDSKKGKKKQEDTLSKELVELFDDEELGWIQSNGIKIL